MPISYIDAQNILLSNNGEDPISSTVPPQDPQVAKTSLIIDRITKQTLEAGHNFNIQVKTLISDSYGVIIVPDCVNIIFEPRLRGNVTIRDGVLWDRCNDDAYTDDIKVLLYLDMSFDSLPEIAKHYVAYEAALEYLSCYGSGMGSGQWAHCKKKRDDAWMRLLNSEYHKISDAAKLHLISLWGGSVGVA